MQSPENIPFDINLTPPLNPDFSTPFDAPIEIPTHAPVAAPVYEMPIPVQAPVAAPVYEMPIPVQAPVAAPIAAPVYEMPIPVQAPVAAPIAAPTPPPSFEMTQAQANALGIDTESVVSTSIPVQNIPVPTPTQQVAQPVVENETGVISRMSSAQFDSFIKILEAINSDTSAMINNIQNGVITLIREGGTLTTKIDHIFGTKNWVFNNPSVQLKKLKFAKGEGDTLIIDDGSNDALISKKSTGETDSIFKLTKVENDFLPPSLSKDYGERKSSCLVEKDKVKKLVDAKSAYEKTSYNITIDMNSFEIVKLHLGEDGTINITNEAGRALKTYVVTQLFPIVEEAYISLYLNNKGEISFKTTVDIYNATISFHIGADEVIKSIVANLDI